MKPCKFCNGETEIIDNGYGLVNNKSIHCKKCGMRLYLPWCTDRETAGKMWDELVGNASEAKWVCVNNPNHSPFDPQEEKYLYICNQCGKTQNHKQKYCPNCSAKICGEIINE